MTMPLPILRGVTNASSKPDEADTVAPTSARPRWNPAGEHPAPGPREEAWLRSAYRQGINPYAFAEGDPIDPALERYYRESGSIPAGQVYVGPDGRYRRVNDAVREDPEINAIRMRAWNGVRFGDLEQLNQSLGDKHPGEDQAVSKMAGAKAQVPTAKVRSADKPTMTRFGLMQLPAEAAGLGHAVIPVMDQEGGGSGIAGAVAAVSGQGRSSVAPEPIASFNPNGYSANSIGPAANDNVSSFSASPSVQGPGVECVTFRTHRPARRRHRCGPKFSRSSRRCSCSAKSRSYAAVGSL
jgi:hypothetical protein